MWCDKGSRMAASNVSIETIVKPRRKAVWRRKWLWLILLVLIGGGGLWYTTTAPSTTTAPKYQTEAAATGDISVKVSAVGTVEPIDEVKVSSAISGTIAAVNVKINDVVQRGQVLASLEASALDAQKSRDEAELAAKKAAVEDASATAAEAQQSLDRSQKKVDRGVASQEDLTTAITTKRRADAALIMAEANVQVAEADLQLSRADLEKACICSPINGVVLDMTASVGQTVSTSTSADPLLILARDLGKMQLQLDVDEADIGKVKLGDKGSFTVEAFQGQIFPATVTDLHYSPQTVDGVVTYRTILSFDNKAHALRPGMTATADIQVQEVKAALLVPNAAFRFSPPAPTVERKRNGLLGVLFSSSGPGRTTTTVTNTVAADGSRSLWVLRNGTAEQISVKTGLSDGKKTEVTAGPLTEGDLIITAAAK